MIVLLTRRFPYTVLAVIHTPSPTSRYIHTPSPSSIESSPRSPPDTPPVDIRDLWDALIVGGATTAPSPPPPLTIPRKKRLASAAAHGSEHRARVLEHASRTRTRSHLSISVPPPRKRLQSASPTSQVKPQRRDSTDMTTLTVSYPLYSSFHTHTLFLITHLRWCKVTIRSRC